MKSKKLIYGLFFAFIVCFAVNIPSEASQSNCCYNSFSEIPWPKFSVKFSYFPGCRKGVHDGMINCLGDCKVCYFDLEVTIGSKTNNDQGKVNFLTRMESNNKLAVVINENFADNDLINAFLNDPSGKFVLSNDSQIVFPEDVQNQLDLPALFVVKGGNYQIIKEGPLHYIILE